MLRFVLDVSVLVSGALSRTGASAAILDAIDEGIVLPVVSENLLDELSEVLDRPRLASIPASVRERLLERLRAHGDVQEDDSSVAFDRDPKDAYLLALAIRQRCPLVTFDEALLQATLPLEVLTPAKACERIRAMRAGASSGRRRRR